MTDWVPIDSAPRVGGKSVIVCWAGRPDSVSLLVWKTNDRIASARKSGQDLDGMVDSYFGDPVEYDDYDLAKPENFPTHWLPRPEVPQS